MILNSMTHNWWWNLRFQYWCAPEQLSVMKINVHYMHFESNESKLIITYMYATEDVDVNSALRCVRDAIRYPYGYNSKSDRLEESIDLMFYDVFIIENAVAQRKRN